CTATCTVDLGWTCPTANAPCQTICGDGRLLGAEQCDDGNAASTDGCTSTCTIEQGWVCATPNAACTATCGDGLVVGLEGCDDTNLTSGDGCSFTCSVEQGWTCPTAGVACATICGDGLLVGGESCDDANAGSGDGCTSACTIEPGFSCTTPGAACTTTCGDGVRAGAETCDDANTLGTDGCSATCSVESGWTCPTEGQTCLATCGDGLVVGPEQCDDNNTVDADGCDANCRFTCGNGTVNPPEECDDGNRIDGDTCEADCTNARCGNSIVDLGEQCDDGNLVDGDACEANCTLPFCGNGIIDVGETCDDGNTTLGDGCENDCTPTPTCTDDVQNQGETGVDCGGPCPAECLVVALPLRGAQVVPVTTSPSRGSCTIVVGGSEQSFSITCSHDVVNATTIEVRNAAVGANGAVVHDLGTATSPVTRTYAISAAELAELRAGRWYVNLTSVASPNGELRGQVATTQVFPVLPRQMVPAVSAITSAACTAYLSPGQTELTLACTHLGFAPGVPTSAIVWRGAPGVNGTQVATLPSTATPILTTLTLSATDAAAYLGGQLYLTMSSAANPGGEIRGQLATFVDSRGAGEQAVPATPSTARMTCRSYLSPDKTHVDLSCTHDVANVTSARLLNGMPWATGTQVFDLGTGTSPITASLTLTPEQSTEYLAGRFAVDVASGAHLSGEVRAQLARNVSFPVDGRQHIPERATVRSGRCMAHLVPAETQLFIECTHDIVDATSAHLHACSGACAGLFRTPFFETATSPFQTIVQFSVTDATDFLAGNFYVHIHSPNFTAGEVRGQVTDTFDFFLDGTQVVPPTGSAATGHCFGFLPLAESPNFILRCTHTVATPSSATLKRGLTGVAGTLIQTIATPGASPFTSQTVLPATFANDVRTGGCYVEVNSTTFPTGEIRGQIPPSTQ
ncbi:DUF4215 domain-containing protein, partial [Myxococcota bacterium]|nr:DUF4215 domain-containing protein [Myxococcota bacterium]